MSRIAVAAVLALLVVGCKDSKQSGSTTDQTAAAGSADGSAGSGSAAGAGESADEPVDHPVYRWWDIPDVEAAEDLRGGALKLGPNRMAVVTTAGKLSLRSCKTELTGRGEITVTISGCGPTVAAKLVDGDLEFPQGFRATRTSPETAAKLDEMVKGGGDTCERARACYQLAWPELGRAGEDTQELGVSATPQACMAFIARTAKDLTAAGKRVPPPCAP